MTSREQSTESLLRQPGSGLGSSTVSTTVHEARNSYSADLPLSYRSGIAPRHVIIQRTSVGNLGGASGGRSTTVDRSSHYGTGVSAGAYASVTSTGVTAVKDASAQEKRDMQDLNERFASYIEKVRFLEAQNRRLADELARLKAKWGRETSVVKAMYQAELDEARKCLDVADKGKARLEISVASLEEQLEEFRRRLDESNRFLVEEKDRNELLTRILSNYESEVGPLRRQVETITRDRDRDRKRIADLQESLNRFRTDLDNETLLHVDAENRRQTLEEELIFVKEVHEQELKEFAALAYRNNTAENREFWKNEMGLALREIQDMYDDKLEGMKVELETFYSLKMQEFRTGAARQNIEAGRAKEETKTLRTQLNDHKDKLASCEERCAALTRELYALKLSRSDREKQMESELNEYRVEFAKLRAQLEAILQELQKITDTKLGLELEIAAYRKLLEGEENRAGLRQLVEGIGTHYAGGGGDDVASESSSYSCTQTSATSGISGYGSVGLCETGSEAGYGARSGASYGYGEAITGRAGGGETRMEVGGLFKGDMTAKTTYQQRIIDVKNRSAKGPIAIAESSPDGKVVVLQNTGKKDEDLTGWRIRRNVDGSDKVEFAFESFVLAPMNKIRVWARGSRPPGSSPTTDLEYHETSWGVGSSVTTKLVNARGEDRATHTQTTHTENIGRS